jgi:transposase
LLTRRPTKVAAIALANKLARMAWATMAKGERYKEPAALWGNEITRQRPA